MTAPGANGAAVATRNLTITGGGTGSGTVTSTPAGINCVITAGVVAATGCKAGFANGTNVVLNAVPLPGHSFTGFSGYCGGTLTCTVPMTQGRTVLARFLVGPFTMKVTGDGSGVGNGVVKTQSGLSPALQLYDHGGNGADGRLPGQVPGEYDARAHRDACRRVLVRRVGRRMQRHRNLHPQRHPGRHDHRQLHQRPHSD